MQIVPKKIGFENNIIYNSNMIQYKHRHTYVYKFELQKRAPYVGWERCEYVLLTNHDDPNCKENRRLLESGLRLAYGNHLPKGVKFSHEKTA